MSGEDTYLESIGGTLDSEYHFGLLLLSNILLTSQHYHLSNIVCFQLCIVSMKVTFLTFFSGFFFNGEFRTIRQVRVCAVHM